MTTYNIDQYCADLEGRIDDAEETALFASWREFTTGGFSGDLFRPSRGRTWAPAVPWPRAYVNDALDNFDAMIIQQLAACSAALDAGSGSILAVRANYGTPILPSLFGARLHRMEYEQDTLPCSYALSREDLVRAIDAGVPDLRGGLGAAVFDAGIAYRKLFARYPLIEKHVHIYHPDTQGPMDVCEMLRGSEIFEDVFDDPAFVHALLDLVTQTYIAFLREWYAIVPPLPGGVSVHWGMVHRGAVLLRDDSAMNFSGAMYEEFIMPYEQRILDEFGGGAIHFCGRGDHYINAASSMRGIYAFNLSQPEYNNLETICRATVDQGIQLIGFPRGAAETLVAAGRDLHGNVHVA
ncbi:MAG TPA: hypothetical protein VGK19_02130 [Capsulimonadaceae bacterium]|jgi:hypothetical protein